jgi:hypothetical protein
MVESKLKLYGLGVAKIIAVGSHSLVHGRGSTPQNLTHYHNLRQLQQIFLPGHIPFGNAASRHSNSRVICRRSDLACIEGLHGQQQMFFSQFKGGPLHLDIVNGIYTQ